MTGLTQHQSVHSHLPVGTAELRREVIEAARGESLAVMLYGSQARGTSGSNSDIDVLQLITGQPRVYRRGRLSVAQYAPSHLHQMAQRGSLFILHLRREGVVLDDPYAILARALEAYREPTSREALYTELAAAAQALECSPEEHRQYGRPLAQLGIYLLRTAVYGRSADAGSPLFDPEAVGVAIGDDRVGTALSWRHRNHLTWPELGHLRDVLADYLPIQARRSGTLEALTVQLSVHSPFAGSLLANVLLGNGRIGYTALALPPL